MENQEEGSWCCFVSLPYVKEPGRVGCSDYTEPFCCPPRCAPSSYAYFPVCSLTSEGSCILDVDLEGGDCDLSNRSFGEDQNCSGRPATLLYKSDWTALCCAPIIPLGTGTHYVVGEAQHQRLAGDKALFLTAPVPVTAFFLCFSALILSRKPNPLRKQRRSKLSYPRGIVAASLN